MMFLLGCLDNSRNSPEIVKTSPYGKQSRGHVYGRQMKKNLSPPRAVKYTDGKLPNMVEENFYSMGVIASSMHPLEQIERSLPHKLTLQLWQEEERLLRAQIHNHDSSCGRIEHEIYQIFGFEFVFQAILVAGAAQASVLDCTTAWVPLILSTAVSLATFLAAFHKLQTHEKLVSQLQAEQSDARALFEYVERLKSLGSRFDLSESPHASFIKTREFRFPSAAEKALQLIWSYKFFVLLGLLVFSILALVSFKQILCSS